MPKIIGKSSRVVEHDGLSIDELAGNVATKEDTLSIARVVVEKPTSEPWLTLHYDEWICILKGKAEFHYNQQQDGTTEVLTATAGQTVMIQKGERFRPVFPEGNTEYIPVCLPAFKPERCIREEGNIPSDVSKKLDELHSKKKQPEVSEKLYHMCQKSLWDKAVASGKAYYPPTFEEDGFFTHATAVPTRLITTANHFYTSVTGDWICLELSHSALKDKAGIITKFEEAKPVGQTDVSDEFENWVCPHIFGGIPVDSSLGIVTKIYPMKRDEKGNYLCIEGLTD
jgi:uncharacterized protein (DUF952 family)